ncbi:Fc.00g114920.m01.CDS01 [Cosmosporella sp. VM-42]
MLKKLKKQLISRPGHGKATEAVSQESPSFVGPEWGLFHLASSPPVDGDEEFPVDIIAIHGLNGNRLSTWTHENKTLWLRDLLPGLLPGCRVLGGIVCKQALVFAHEDGTLYGDILSAALTTQTPMIKTDLLDYLHYNGRLVQDLSISVRNRLGNMTVVSFYETAPTPPLSTLLVDRASAILGYYTRTSFPYSRAIEVFVASLGRRTVIMPYLKPCEELHGNAKLQSRRTLSVQAQGPPKYVTSNNAEKSYMALLGAFNVADHKRCLPRPAEGTLQWILSHPFFVSWAEGPDNSILWLTGHPGCGKTTLSLFLSQYLEESSLRREVYTYFCDGKANTQKDAQKILLGLIFQIVCQHRTLIRHIKTVYELYGSSMVHSFSALWAIFVNVLRDPKPGPLYIIIDALDECEPVSCQHLVDSIHKLVRTSAPPIGDEKPVKFMFTSRPSLQFLPEDDYLTGRRIPIDEGQAGHDEDIRTFIK